MQSTGAEKKPPLRYQFLTVIGILLFTAMMGGVVYGVKAAGTAVYLKPICEKSCATANAQFVDVEVHEGKREHDSMCICSNGARIHVGEADTVASISVLSEMMLAFLVTGAMLFFLWRRARKKDTLQ